MKPSRRLDPRRIEPEAGLTLVEVTLAMGLFAVLILSVAMTLLRGTQHRRQTFQEYVGLSALRDFVAEVQETANLPQNLSLQQGVGSVYLKYNSKSYSVPNLTSGAITVTCYANEATVPTQLGGPQDLNFDGDALDDLGNMSTGTDMKLVPMALALTFTDDYGARTISIERLITKTTN